MSQADRFSTTPIPATHGHFQSCSFKHVKVSATLTDCFSENQISSMLVPCCMLSGAIDERSPSVPALQPPSSTPSRTGTGFENPRAHKAQALFEDLAQNYLWVKDLLCLAKNNREGSKAMVVGFVLFLLCFFFLNLGNKHKPPLFWKTGWLQFSTMELTSQCPLPPSDPSGFLMVIPFLPKWISCLP